jgi:hypothetical protein
MNPSIYRSIRWTLELVALHQWLHCIECTQQKATRLLVVVVVVVDKQIGPHTRAGCNLQYFIIADYFLGTT